MKVNKKVWILGLVLLTLPAVYALLTTTQVSFNVQSVVAYTLTLPGQSGVSATGGGAATAAIEFNITNATATNVDAVVVGGTAQSNGTAIFQFKNTGTLNLNLSVYMNATTNISATPCKITLKGNTTYDGANPVNAGTTIANSSINQSITVVNAYTPVAAAQDFYLKADFTGTCYSNDTAVRTLKSQGIQS